MESSPALQLAVHKKISIHFVRLSSLIQNLTKHYISVRELVNL